MFFQFANIVLIKERKKQVAVCVVWWNHSSVVQTKEISKSVERVTTNESFKGCYSISSPGTSIDEVVQFNVCQTDDKVVVINEIKRQSIIAQNTVPKKKGNTSHCNACGKEDSPTKGRKGKKVDLVDCDHYSKWAHWRNLRKNNWLCEAHK